MINRQTEQNFILSNMTSQRELTGADVYIQNIKIKSGCLDKQEEKTHKNQTPLM